MRYLVVAIGAILLVGCGRGTDCHSPATVSPSGSYAASATVNRADRSKPDYAYVMLHLLDVRASSELQVYRSRAGDAQKWALGWLPDRDVLVLYSADVGSMAFRIAGGKLEEISPLDNEMRSRAQVLKDEKHGPPDGGPRR